MCPPLPPRTWTFVSAVQTILEQRPELFDSHAQPAQDPLNPWRGEDRDSSLEPAPDASELVLHRLTPPMLVGLAAIAARTQNLAWDIQAFEQLGQSWATWLIWLVRAYGFALLCPKKTD